MISAKNSLTDIETRIANLEEERRWIGTASGALKERKQDVNRIKAFFAPRERPLAFVEALEDVARRARTRITLALDQSRAEADALTFQATVEGSESGLATMLELIETMPYSLAIERLNYERRGDQLRSPAASGADTGTPARLTAIITVQTQ